MKILRLLPALAAAVCLSSCAVSNPASRISQQPAVFAALPASQKALVQTGQIAEGMTKDAVYLAWGRPDGVLAGSENGKSTELWRYTRLQPVYRQRIGMGMGWGYGPYCGRGRRHYDPFYDQGLEYVPVTAGVVRFRNGKVTGWEAAR